MTTITLTQVKKFAKSQQAKDLQDRYYAALALSIQIREQVNAIQKPIFDSYVFLDDEVCQITDHDDLYRCDDEDLVTAYYEAVNAAIAVAGFADYKDGYCPALKAEHAVRKIRLEIVEAQCKLLNVPVPTSLDHHKKFLDLFLQLKKK